MKKEILEKMYAGSTDVNLSEQKVELATILRINDYKKWLDNDIKKNKEFNDAVEKLKKDFFATDFNSLFVEQDLENFVKKVEELGLDPNVSPDYKESLKILELIKKEEKFFGDRKKKYNL